MRVDGRGAGDGTTDAGTRRRWSRLRVLLAEALDRPADDRTAFLARTCAGDPELRRELESLLASHLRRGPLDDLVEAPLAASALAASPTDSEGSHPARQGERLGRYRIVRLLGGGGMGVVFEARDERLDRQIALKLLPWHLASDDSARRRFLAEARAAAAIDHPNICTVHEIGEAEDGRLFIAMALYAGGSLRDRVAHGPLPVAEAVELALQAARGLEAAHAHGIVHRDIKPGNLMVSSEGVLKIVDFGVARSGGSVSTGRASPLGTVSYMSPEQARGEPVDARTDIWSLGVVLYELLSGERPFGGGAPAAILRAIVDGEPPAVDRVRAGVPEGLAGVVARCLARDPDARFTGAAELRRALEGVARGLAVPDARVVAGTGAPRGLSEEGERRPVCVVVSLLAGYPQWVERLEPGRLEVLQERIATAAAEVAAGHGGVVNERAGDRIVWLFGVPAAHEDDLARAVRAARELHGRIRRLESDGGLSPARLRLRLRSGVSWGLAVVRPARTGAKLYAVAGAPRELAGRLADHAEEDEVLVAGDGGARLGDFFRLQPAPALRLREGTVPARRVVGDTGIRGRLEASERHGLTPFAGRGAELGLLRDALERTRAGTGGTVAVLGEGGVGKSRLLYEFRHGLAAGIQVLQGRCQSYGARVPYLPFVEALRERLEPSTERPAPARVEAVAGHLRRLGAELEEHLPLYLHLLSIPSETHPLPDHLESSALRAALVDALAAYFTLCAQDDPLVLLLEDWHWVDRASDLVLRRLSEMASTCSLLAVVTLRPEQATNLDLPREWTHLRLRPLELEAARSMVSALLDAAEVPPRLARTLHERTGGNAFFLEETVKTLQEQGALRTERGSAVLDVPGELRLPATIQGVIRTRLDRLDPEAREVLRVASVIGREFSVPVLERALPPGHSSAALDRLCGLALVQRMRPEPHPTHPTYRFSHALTQEVAYDSLLERQRVRLHGRVARAIEATAQDRLPGRVDRLAYHFRHAEEWERAVRYGREAAEKAAALSEFTEAVEALDAALECVDHLPEEDRRPRRTELLFLAERYCETLGLRDRQRAIVDELIASLEPAGPSPELAEALLRRADLHILLRRHEEAECSLERSLALRRTLGDPEGTRNTLRSFGLLRWHQDRVSEALAFVEEALAIDRARGDLHGMAGDLSNLGSLYKALGEPERALACLEKALELVERVEAEGRSMWKKRCHVLHHLANAHRALGDDARALACLEEADRHAKAHRSSDHGAFHLTAMAHIRLRQGRMEEALRLYRRSVYLARKAKNTERLAQSLRILGDVLLGLGRAEEALPCLREAAECFRRLGDDPAEAAMCLAAGRALEQMGEPAEAATAWRRARALCRERGDAGGELEAATGLARSLRRVSPRIAARAFEEALRIAGRSGRRREEVGLANSLAILRWEAGEYEAAQEQWERMRDAARTLGDREAEGLALNSLGRTLERLGRVEEARARLEDALRLHRSAGNRLLEAHALAARGDLEFHAGRAPAACRDYRAALERRRQLGDRLGEGWMRLALARAGAAGAEIGVALGHLERARAIAEEEGSEELAAACRRAQPSLSAVAADREGPRRPRSTPSREEE